MNQRNDIGTGAGLTSVRFHLKRAVRLIAGLYVAACVLFGTLGAMGLVAMMFANDPNRGEEANVALVANTLRRQPKTLDLTALNKGDWSLACVLGQMASPGTVVNIAAVSKRIPLSDSELARLHPQKSHAWLLYLQKSGTVRRFLPPDDFAYHVAVGETACVTPDAPVIVLPTAAALKQYPLAVRP